MLLRQPRSAPLERIHGALSPEFDLESGDFDACLAYASDVLAHEPCREDAHRFLMRYYLRRGQRAQALRQYRLCEAILRSELDVEPEEATTCLFDQVRTRPNLV